MTEDQWYEYLLRQVEQVTQKSLDEGDSPSETVERLRMLEGLARDEAEAHND